MIQKPVKNMSVRVELLLDDFAIWTDGIVLDHDAGRDLWLVQTNWGEDWFQLCELVYPATAT